MIKKICNIFNSTAIKNYSIYSLGEVLLGLINFILLPIYSRYLSPEAYGIFGLLLIFTNVAVIIINSGFKTIYSLKYYKADSNKINNLYIIMIHYLILFFLLLAIFNFKPNLISSLLKITLPQIIEQKVLLMVFFTLLTEFFLDMLIIQGKALFYFVISVFRAIIFGCSNLILLIVFAQSYEAYINSTLLVLSIISAISIIYYLKKFPLKTFRFDFVNYQDLLKLGLPIVAGGLIAMVISSGDRYLLNILINPAAVGIYTMGCKFGELLNRFLTTPFGQTTHPVFLRLYSSDREKSKKYLADVSYLFFILALIFILAMFAILDVFFHYFMGASYWSSYNVIILICLSMIFVGLVGFFGLIFGVKEKTYLYPVFTVFAGVLNIILNFLLIPSWGVYGAAWATLITYIIHMIVFYLTNQRLMYIPYRLKDMLKIAMIFLIFIGLQLFFSDMANISYYKVFLKIILFFGFLGLILKMHYQEIKQLIKQ